MNVQEQIKSTLPANRNQNAVTCESCIGSLFKCHQNANYGSSMVKTAKITPFQTLRLDMDFTQ